MQRTTKSETLVYHERLVHKEWLDKVVLSGVRPPKEASDLVSSLLIAYAETAPDFESRREDSYRTAYELAALLMADTPISKIYTHYRDHLIDAMLEFMGERSPEQYESLLEFSNTISTAFCEAHSDSLRKTIRRERMKTFSSELKTAKAIQSHLLPRTIPEIPGFEFAGRLLPAEEIGGDYWSIKHYPEDGVVTMKLADISGHGVAAATLVAAVKFVSGGYYRNSESASEVMIQTNRVLTRETPHDILITMAYGWLHPTTYKLTIVNAGHEPLFICSGTTCQDIAPTGPVLGVQEDAEYFEKTFKLNKHDLVFFGSDGITEAGIGQRFGMERLKELVMGNSLLSADEIADRVIQTVSEFSPDSHDDISLLVIKVVGDPPE